MANVIIVEDEPEIRMALSRIVEGAGHQATCVEDPQNALGAIERNHPDIVLLDIMMPGLSGFEVLGQIRRSTTMNDLPVILVTAKGQDQDLEKARELGADDYIVKPWGKGEVEGRVNRVLRERSASQHRGPFSDEPAAPMASAPAEREQ